MNVENAPIIGGVFAIISTLIAVIAGPIIYRRQRNIDYEQELRKECRQAYIEYVKAFNKFLKSEDMNDLNIGWTIFLIAPDNVCLKLHNQIEYLSKYDDPHHNDARIFYKRLREAMREDIVGKKLDFTAEASKYDIEK